jgi:hypothetical protein
MIALYLPAKLRRFSLQIMTYMGTNILQVSSAVSNSNSRRTHLMFLIDAFIPLVPTCYCRTPVERGRHFVRDEVINLIIMAKIQLSDNIVEVCIKGTP